ncbi:hypothetical protein AHF37_10441 [Paragonimus kellicotti]|nr:hypothetical protein AHF37_10441 [Paragonimus kellicotti]
MLANIHSRADLLGLVDTKSNLAALFQITVPINREPMRGGMALLNPPTYGLNAICPTEDNMVASAKLLTLSGMSTARVSLRCPLLSLTQAKPVGQANTIDVASAEQVTTWPSFEMRVHLDLGAIVACACPSQFYWLQLFVGQLSHIWQNYTNRKTLVPYSDRGSRPASPESPLVSRPGHRQRVVQVVGNERLDGNQVGHAYSLCIIHIS